METLILEENLFGSRDEEEPRTWDPLTWGRVPGIIVSCSISLKFTVVFPCKPIFSIPLFCVCKSQWSENIKGVDSKVLENFANGLSPPHPPTRAPLSGLNLIPVWKGWKGTTRASPSSFSDLSGPDCWKNNPYHTQTHTCLGAIFSLKFLMCPL